MSLYKMYETDPDLEKGGIILDYGDGEKIKIARAGGANESFAVTLERVTRPYRKRMDAHTLDNSVANELYIQVFAESVVKGWEGIKDRDDKTLKFTVDNCVQLFKDLPDLFSDVREAANDVSNFRVAEIEEDIKN